MTREFNFTCPLANGVHARPASALEEVAAAFGAEILLINSRTGRTANAKSVLSIVGADIRHQDPCRFLITGVDAPEAVTALTRFIQEEFPKYDEATPAEQPGNGQARWLSPTLAGSGAQIRQGTPVVGGIGRGALLWASAARPPEAACKCVDTDPQAELRKLDAGLAGVISRYEEQLARHVAGLEKDLLAAHRSIARDPEFRARLHEGLKHGQICVAKTIAETETYFTDILARSESALLRERALDIQDVCSQLLVQIYGQSAITVLQLEQASILVAEALTPGQLLGLNRRHLQGLVLGHAGTTSHTVILARSFGIPTLAGVQDLSPAALAGKPAILDAGSGVLLTGLTEPAQRYFEMEARRLQGRADRQKRFLTLPGATADGHQIAVACNIATAPEATAAFECGADAIGLFRTEMLFLDRPHPPGEEEQFEAYRSALSAAGPRPVVVRTLDVGGDKPLAYLNLPPEENPYLGYRAVRMYPEFESQFRTQVRAMVRASAHGNLHCLIPMITSLEEVAWVKEVIASEQARCRAEAVPFNPAMPVGAMLEVPASAFLIPELARELDFFSVGSNDLLQYFAAADRGNLRLAHLHSRLQPAFLRLLKHICDEVRAAGKPLSLCGEMAGQLLCLPLLAGLGFDEISVAPCATTAIKAELASWTLAECREVLHRALACGTEPEVRQVLEHARAHDHLAAPVVDAGLIILHSDCQTKAEAIKEAVDRLYVLGRTDSPRTVEQAVWEREESYPTGFGNGFAIPHCKTDAVGATSVCLLKLDHPVEWGSIDNQPVDIVILLAVRASDQAGGHMKILSRLARRLIHDDFREALRSEQDSAALCAHLQACLNG